LYTRLVHVANVMNALKKCNVYLRNAFTQKGDTADAQFDMHKSA